MNGTAIDRFTRAQGVDLVPMLQMMTREEAIAYVSSLYDDLHAGAVLWSDAELADRFLASCSRTNSIETRKSYDLDLRWFAKWLHANFPGIQLRQLRPYHADQYVDHLRRRLANGEIKPRTLNRRISSLQALWRWASEPSRSGVTGIVRTIWPRNSMIATTKTARPMSSADIGIVLREIEAAAMAGDRKAQRDYVMVRGSYLIGCRISELCCLRWQDVEALPDGSGQIHIHGKGSKVRTVCVSPATLALFESLGRGNPVDWLFPGRNGHITRQAVCDKMRRWGRSVGVHLHPMKLRHSHATHSIQNGCDPFVLQKSLGHSSIATTAHYVRANPRDSSSLRLS